MRYQLTAATSRRLAGFTLVELLVALFITAILFTLGYRSLAQALTGRQEVEQHAARLLAVQKAVHTIEQDFELLTPRPVRNLLGDGYEPAITTGQTGLLTAASSVGSGGAGSGISLNGSTTLGGTNGLDSTSILCAGTGGGATSRGSPVVTLTRAGWTNPAGLQRTELQRVSYFLDSGALVRAYYPVLDATPGDPVIRRVLLDHVRNFSIRFMDAGRQCRSDWPAGALGAVAQRQTLRIRPVAVEVTLQLDDWGTLVRVIEIAG